MAKKKIKSTQTWGGYTPNIPKNLGKGGMLGLGLGKFTADKGKGQSPYKFLGKKSSSGTPVSYSDLMSYGQEMVKSDIMQRKQRVNTLQFTETKIGSFYTDSPIVKDGKILPAPPSLLSGPPVVPKLSITYKSGSDIGDSLGVYGKMGMDEMKKDPSLQRL